MSTAPANFFAASPFDLEAASGGGIFKHIKKITMKYSHLKTYQALRYGDKLPRKVKKNFLGLRLGKAKLKKLLQSVEIVKAARTMYESPVIKPYLFCPKCGCTSMRGSGNQTSYPEHWEYFYCSRCQNTVGYIDNSPFIHALECAENNYDPVF